MSLKCAIILSVCTALVHFDVHRDKPLIKRSAPSSSPYSSSSTATAATASSWDETHEIQLENTFSYYKTELHIGNPPQKVAVQIDTGSSDLWVISSANPLCKTATTLCGKSSIFNASRSNTFQQNQSQPFSISYGDYTFASGYFVQDSISFDGFHGESSVNQLSLGENDEPFSQNPGFENSVSTPSFTISAANFAMAERSNSSEAVWGIGMETTESIAKYVNSNGDVYPTYPNLPKQMKQQGLIETVSYSLWLNDLRSSSGSLLFGGVDHSKYKGSLQKVPMVSTRDGINKPIDFSVVMNGMSIYNKNNISANVVDCSVPVLLDSGTTYSQLPLALIEPVASILGAIYDENNNLFVLRGDKKKHLNGAGVSFNLSGISIDVGADELLVPVAPLRSLYDGGDHEQHYLERVAHKMGNQLASSTSESQKTFDDSIIGSDDFYLLGMLPVEQDTQGSYILGDTFLRSAYVVYDLENYEIALANAAHDSQNSRPSIDTIDSNGIPSATKAPLYDSTSVHSSITTYSVTNLFSKDNMGSVSTVKTGHHVLSDVSTNGMPSQKVHGSKHKNSGYKLRPRFILYAISIFSLYSDISI